jgi:hypothetical protein
MRTFFSMAHHLLEEGTGHSASANGGSDPDGVDDAVEPVLIPVPLNLDERHIAASSSGTSSWAEARFE